MTFSTELEHFFSTVAPLEAGDRLLVAYSGGPDSTALLWGLGPLSERLGLRVRALHVDHGLDPDSSRRARRASGLCAQLGVSGRVVRRSVPRESRRGESEEVAARRLRYASLEEERQRLGAKYIVTAHHADDQIETILLRMAFGSGLAGLAGMRPRHGHLVRPLLSYYRRELEDIVARSGLQPVRDPTNLRLEVPRNRMRHVILPRLQSESSHLGARLLAVGEAASRMRSALHHRLRAQLGLVRTDEGSALLRLKLLELPDELWPFALSMLHWEAGLPYPPCRAARRELHRQLRDVHRVGCDCGGGWRWESDGDLLKLCRPTPSTAAFAYTLEVPGECDIHELSLRFGLRRGPVADWMFRSSPRRAGLALPLREGDRVVIRSRRPGDRVRPFGCPYSRRLKDLLIDRRVPRTERGRLPLLEVNSRVTWVPGVTVDDSCRVSPGGQAWIAELEPQQGR